MLGHTVPQSDPEYIFRLPYFPLTELEKLVPVLVSYLSVKYRTLVPLYYVLGDNEFLKFVTVFSGMNVNLFPYDENMSHLPEIKSWFGDKFLETIKKDFRWCKHIRLPTSDVFLSSLSGVDIYLQLVAVENSKKKLISKKLSLHYGIKFSEIYWSCKRVQERFSPGTGKIVNEGEDEECSIVEEEEREGKRDT